MNFLYLQKAITKPLITAYCTLIDRLPNLQGEDKTAT